MFKKQYLIFNVLFFLSLLYPDWSTNIKFGYDSNIMKYSDIENPISSNLFQISGSYKTKFDILQRKTRFSIHTKKSIYELSEKSNYSYGIKIKQPIGDYRYVSFNYTYIDNIYLREYVDVDQGVVDFIYEGTDCHFDNTKLNLDYQFPILNKNSKINISYTYETQFYNRYFTEFDLEIDGLKIKYSTKIKEHKYNISLRYKKATNITLNDITLSTSYMDRGYSETNFILLYRYDNMGVSADLTKRNYSSNITEDQLHINRKHDDVIYSFWYYFNIFDVKNKFVLKYRERDTSAMYVWVEQLKTFDKFNIEHSVYF